MILGEVGDEITREKHHSKTQGKEGRGYTAKRRLESLCTLNGRLIT